MFLLGRCAYVRVLVSEFVFAFTIVWCIVSYFFFFFFGLLCKLIFLVSSGYSARG